MSISHPCQSVDRFCFRVAQRQGIVAVGDDFISIRQVVGRIADMQSVDIGGVEAVIPVFDGAGAVLCGGMDAFAVPKAGRRWLS